MATRAWILRWACVLSSAAGCAYTRSAEVPMPTERHPTSETARGVVVFLPGLGDSPQEFVENGFVEQVNAWGFDAITPDCHFGYYRERILKPRLHADVIRDLADRYDQVWLVGISLGGFGAALYTSENIDRITGVIMLAPYLGEEEDWEDIERSGGLAAWDPGDLDAIEDKDRQEIRRMWAWLKTTAQTGQPTALYLGIGDEDRFLRPASLVTRVIPQERATVMPGDHNWTTWKQVFATLGRRAFEPR